MKKGFTLLEILLVIAATAILASIVIVAINPARQLAQAHNAERRAEILEVLNAVHQYTIDNNGTLPTTIPTASDCDADATQEICRSGVSCTNLVVLSALTSDERYLTALPEDPTGVGTLGTGYFIVKSTNGRVTVCAPSAELEEEISVSL